MPSQSIYTEIIKLPYRKYSKAFALLLIRVHEMIDYFLGVDTIIFLLGVEGEILWFCHRRLAVVNLHFIKKDRSSQQYFITQGIGQSSMFLIFRTAYN